VNTVSRKLSQLSNNFDAYREKLQAVLQDVTETPSVSQKLKRLRRGIGEVRLMYYLIKGYGSDEITPYDDEFKQKLSDESVRNISVARIIDDFIPSDDATNGHCFERSFLMFLCVENASWVYGDNKIIELAHGKANAAHAWVEVGNHVYDPTTVLKYPKDLYYKMLKINNAIKLTHDDIARCGNNVGAKLSAMVNNYLDIVSNQIQQGQNYHEPTDKGLANLQ